MVEEGFPEDTTSYGTGIEQVAPKADADHDERDEGRPMRTSSRWWPGRAQEGPGASASEQEEPVEGRRRDLADVGHELKSPLSIMLALCTRLEAAGRLAPEDAEDVARIRANAYIMLRRVQDMMLVARLENADLQLEAAVVDVADVVRSCVKGFDSLAAQRDLELRLRRSGPAAGRRRRGEDRLARQQPRGQRDPPRPRRRRGALLDEHAGRPAGAAGGRRRPGRAPRPA